VSDGYSAALLRRQKAQAKALERQQLQQEKKPAKLAAEHLPQLQQHQHEADKQADAASPSQLQQQEQGASAAAESMSCAAADQSHCSVAAPPAVVHAAGGCSPFSNTCNTIPGLHVSHMRREVLPHPSKCSEAGPEQEQEQQRCCSPSEVGSATGGFGFASLLRRTSSNSSGISTGSADSGSGGAAAKRASKYGVPTAAARGRSVLLSALDAATAANARATAALRAAAKRARHAAKPASAQPAAEAAAAAVTGASSEAAAATVIAGSSSNEAAAAATEAEASEEQLADLASIVMGWYADPEDAVCLVVQAASGAGEQGQQLGSATAGAAAAAADTSCMAKSICGVGYSRLQRGDSLQQQEQLQQAEEDAAAAAAAAQSQEQEQDAQCLRVLHVEPCAAAEAVDGTPAHAAMKSALLLSDSSLLSPFWIVATSSVGDVAADAEEDQPGAPLATEAAAIAAAAITEETATVTAATICSSTTAAAAAPVTVEELLAASEAVIVQLEAAFAGVRHTAGLLAEARVPLRERYGN
jgi:hypothetical protein